MLYPAVSSRPRDGGDARRVPRGASAADEAGHLDLAAVSDQDAERALLLWTNSPNNPTGRLDDLATVAAWGRSHDVPVFSDECYTEFTWDAAGRRRSCSTGSGVVAVHSLSKRSNLAGVRVGFSAGDGALGQLPRRGPSTPG